MDEDQGKECPGLPIPGEDDVVMVQPPSFAACSGLWSRRKHPDTRNALVDIKDNGRGRPLFLVDLYHRCFLASLICSSAYHRLESSFLGECVQILSPKPMVALVFSHRSVELLSSHHQLVSY